MNTGYSKIYAVLFQLWLDEITMATYDRRKIDASIYEKMYYKLFEVGLRLVPDPIAFQVMVDDSFVMLDVSAAIHCDDLGSYGDIADKRVELSQRAFTGDSFFSKVSREVSLVSEDVDLVHVFDMFNRLDTETIDLTDPSMIPIVGKSGNATFGAQLH